jgi:hypothetical protein
MSEKELVNKARFDLSMMSGGIAGSIGKTITAPLSRLTILYQVHPLMKSAQGNTGGTLGYGNNLSTMIRESRTILRDEGLLSFWRGNLTSVLHRFPYSAINFSCYEWMKRKLHNDLNYQENVVSRLICGAYAGGVACFAVYPLDLVRTQLSANVHLSSDQNKKGSNSSGWYESKIITQMRRILNSEGLPGLYRGLLISMAVSIPNLAIGFAAYGSIKEHLLYREKSGYFRSVSSTTPPKGKSLNLNNFGTILCGAFAGISSSLVIFPLDVVRRRLQIFGAVRHENTAIPISQSKETVSMTQIAKREGFKGFYRGILPELLKVVPMVTITFYVYEASMMYLSA